MNKLPLKPTVGEVKLYLLAVIDRATDDISSVNPSFTKNQMWDFYMGQLLGADNDTLFAGGDTSTCELFRENIFKDFGIGDGFN